METLRKILSISFVLLAGALVTFAELVGGYKIEFDISDINKNHGKE